MDLTSFVWYKGVERLPISNSNIPFLLGQVTECPKDVDDDKVEFKIGDVQYIGILKNLNNEERQRKKLWVQETIVDWERLKAVPASSRDVDIVISFDTTGSMYPCLSELRAHLKDLVTRLFRDIPNLRMSIVSHGDYCDGDDLFSKIDFTNNSQSLINFVTTIPSTAGGDFPEAYEYVLNQATKMDWKSEHCRALVMIGDAPPHSVQESKRQSGVGYDWEKETLKLANMGVTIYSIQCLRGNRESTNFYKTIANMTNGAHLRMSQFAYLRDILVAIALRQVDACGEFEAELQERRMPNNMRQMFDVLLGRAEGKNEDEERSVARPRRGPVGEGRVIREGINPCEPSRFQVLSVIDDCDIKSFCTERGLVFAKGRGFYEFTKKEKIQKYKEIVLMDRETGDLFEGKGARELLELPDEDVNVSPKDHERYRIFIQSTSANRKLIGGTGFLYEVPSSPV